MKAFSVLSILFLLVAVAFGSPLNSKPCENMSNSGAYFNCVMRRYRPFTFNRRRLFSRRRFKKIIARSPVSTMEPSPEPFVI